MAQLPASTEYGYVVGRILLAVEDTTTESEDNRYPDALVPINSSVRFTPIDIMAVGVPSTLVIKKSINGKIGEDGILVDNNEIEGIWLVTGRYSVTFDLKNQGSITPFQIEITSGHTELDPLDIVPLIPRGNRKEPIPQWMFLTNDQYEALPSKELGTLYLIGRANG